MKITLHPETPEEEAAIRRRATSVSLSDSLALYFDRPTVAEAAQRWAAENKPRPKPGSIVRHNNSRMIRVVKNDGYLMTLDGITERPPEEWDIGTGKDDYSIIFDMEEQA